MWSGGETTGNEYLDFLPSDERNKNIRYRVATLFQERESLPAETMATVRDFSDDELLEMLQEYTFCYFWEGAHQESGKALESGNGTAVAPGVTGMGLMAMIAAHTFRMNMKITGWNECLGTYLMATSSPTHSITKEVYSQGWARNGDMVRKRTYYNQEISLSPDWGVPLFWIHYSHLGIDPRGLKDQYAEYWKEHTATVRIHHAYAVANPQGWKNYSDKCWGLTASDDPYGYTSHQAVSNDNGTISPTAALASMPYAPAEAIKALKYFYRERGSELWGKYGPRDAFNDQLGWVRDAWLGIDQGPIMVMTENYRSALLWNLVMDDPDVKAGLQKLEFQYDPATTAKSKVLPAQLNLFPNPCSGKATISPAMECGAWPPGIYLVKVTSGKEIFTGRLLVAK